MKKRFIITVLIFILSSLILSIESKDVLAETITRTIVATADDTSSWGDDWSNTQSGALVGYNSAGGWNPGHSSLRFRNITITQGTTITSAYLTFKAAGTAGTPTNLSIYGENVDNATQITSLADFNARTLTTAPVNYVPSTWTTGTVYNSVDISSIIQKIINRAGWSSSNSIQIFWKYVGGTDGTYRIHYNLDGTPYATGLTITYRTPPTATVSRPDNLAIFNTPITFEINTTDNNQLYNVSLIANWTGSWAVNETTIINGTSNSTTWNINVLNGKYSWSCYACDTYSNCVYASENRTFTFDNINPNINITFPLNTTYAIPPTKISYIVSDTNLQSCWYSLDKGTTNTTITCGNNVTDLSSNVGSNTWTIYVNDSASNTNKSVVTFTYTQANNFIIQNSTNENQTYFIINTIGNVGFGTSGPTSTLTVSGDMKMNGLYVNSTDMNISTGSYQIESYTHSRKFYIDGTGNLIIL
ncbi:MAG: hypothetical protein NT139_01840 [Candidatus Woesearchaeota archaeon]|nr:hypothetical protein [Candidatus Woesearchaeota archaeon]